MAKAALALQILPLETGTQERSLEIIDRVIKDLEANPKLSSVVSPFETTLEGEFDDLFDALKQAVLTAGADGEDIFTNVKIHYQKDGYVLTSEEKTAPYNKH